MKFQKLVTFSLLLLCTSLLIQIVSTNSDTSANIESDDDDEDQSNMFFEEEDHQDHHGGNFATMPMGGVHSRFLAGNDDSDSTAILANYTCDLYPTVCRYKKSDTRDCCGKKCVNVMTDRLNCFKCGRVCNQGELCCKGKCVNIYSDRKHCGGCNIKCRKRIKCDYGVCGYAG